MTWTFEKLKKTLLQRPGSYEDFPFGPDASVFKVKSKMFALSSPGENDLRVNLKCYPEEAEVQRAMFDAVLPGYHMNKRHWNTVVLDGSIPAPLIEEMIDTSYDLVVKGLKKSEREMLIGRDPRKSKAAAKR